MSGRQAANFFTRTTAILAALFMLNSLWLSVLAARQHDVSLVDRIQKASEQPFEQVPADQTEDGSEQPLEQAPAVPNTPE